MVPRPSPDLLVGLAADPQHLLALELQLLGEGADVLVERVDLVVQLGDVALPPGHLVLELRDAGKHLTLLGVQEGGALTARWRPFLPLLKTLKAVCF